MRAAIRRCSLAIAVSCNSANRANKCQIVWNNTGVGGYPLTGVGVLWSAHTANTGLVNREATNCARGVNT